MDQANTVAAAPPSCVLGFDFGRKRIGVAVGNTVSCTARPLEVIERQDDTRDWARILAVVNGWRPELMVVGDPLTLNGGVQEITHVAREFATVLREKTSRPVVLVDERSSSKEADRRFAAARAAGVAHRKQAGQQDALAASVILERWFESGMPTSDFGAIGVGSANTP